MTATHHYRTPRRLSHRGWHPSTRGCGHLRTGGRGLRPAAASAAKPRVTVTRDSAGIPHIVGKDFRSVGYGEGYAYAQDNLCMFADDVITLRAQRPKYFGPDALFYQYAGGGAVDPNWKSDLWWKRVRYSRVVEKATAQKPPLGPNADVKALYKGWAGGYNAYLRSGKLRDPPARAGRG